jgi:hypothetical protein
MLTFFRKTKESLTEGRPISWLTLLTEVVLIFVGITLALWFDSQNQRRADRHLEVEVLSQMVSALVSDTNDLANNLGGSAKSIAAIDTVLVYLEEKRPYNSKLAEHFGRATIWTMYLENRSAYEYLKTVGFDIIQNKDLRIDISQYYEFEGQWLKTTEEFLVKDNYNGSVRPQMIEKFSYGLLEPAVPNDYSALISDLEYRSLLTTTRSLLQYKDRRTRILLDEAKQLIRAINSELANL